MRDKGLNLLNNAADAKPYRSRRTTHGRNMSGARSLWRAAGMGEQDFDKPIIAIANSFTQFVPGHAHLHNMGQLVKEHVDAAGGYGVEFNTIAVDDGIAMGHDGMLYSLPSRDLIADSVEYMVEAHVADALVCISNCDKITPGMLMAAMRLNIPTVFVSGGPMEAGKGAGIHDREGRPVAESMDLVHAIAGAADASLDDEALLSVERSACPTCGSCSGMFTANSMNCLTEALGLSLPGNGSLLATHAMRKELFVRAAGLVVELAKRHYIDGDHSVLPRGIVTKQSVENAMIMDVAMGGSTNTVLHLLAVAHEAKVDFTMADIDRISRLAPTLCKVAPSSDYHMEDVNRAGGVFGILGELDRAGLLKTDGPLVHSPSLAAALDEHDFVRDTASDAARQRALAAPGGVRTTEAFSQDLFYPDADDDREAGCVRSRQHAYSQDGGLAVLYGNLAEQGCIVKTAGVAESVLRFQGKARVFESQDDACHAILGDRVKAGDVVVIRYEGPRGGPGMQEMLYPTTYIKSKGLGEQCALITDGRFSGGTAGLSIGHISPEAADGGLIGLVQDGDPIEIDIPERRIHLALDAAEIAARRQAMNDLAEQAFKPRQRDRRVSLALQSYALMTTSAAQGAVRDLSNVKREVR